MAVNPIQTPIAHRFWLPTELFRPRRSYANFCGGARRLIRTFGIWCLKSLMSIHPAPEPGRLFALTSRVRHGAVLACHVDDIFSRFAHAFAGARFDGVRKLVSSGFNPHLRG